jgi:cholest-4-en-3-one 26-monooxygenase
VKQTEPVPESALGVDDLTSPDTFVAGVPHELFARLRREAPVARTCGADGQSFWSVTRHEDVVRISRDPKTFSSNPQPATANPVLINMDPPAHTRYRQLVSTGFSPRTVAAMEVGIRQRASLLIERALERGQVDFVTEVAARLPLQVICDLMGIPVEDHDLVLGWSNRLLASDDPEYQELPESRDQAQGAAYAYFTDLAGERRSKPKDDLVTKLVQAEIDGEHLSEFELALFCILLLIGGNETTRNTLAHSVIALSARPDQRAQLANDPSLWPGAVEEALRYSSALMQFTRRATIDTEIAGQRIAKDDLIALWFSSANRDEQVFLAPDRFDVARVPTKPIVTFGGGGPHICLGASLARLEIQVLLQELLARTSELEVLGPPARLRSSLINGIKHLPLRMMGRAA